MTGATVRAIAKPKKQFDCIKMKRDIQAKLYRRWKGRSLTDIIDQIRKDIAEATDPLVVRFRSIPTVEERRIQQTQKRQRPKKKTP